MQVKYNLFIIDHLVYLVLLDLGFSFLIPGVFRHCQAEHTILPIESNHATFALPILVGKVALYTKNDWGMSQHTCNNKTKAKITNVSKMKKRICTTEPMILSFYRNRNRIPKNHRIRNFTKKYSSFCHYSFNFIKQNVHQLHIFSIKVFLETKHNF